MYHLAGAPKETWYHDRQMAGINKTAPESRRKALREILIYGLCGGVLVSLLKLAQYHFLIIENSAELYAGLVAILFSGVGIWLGLMLNRRRRATAQQETAAEGPFVVDEARLKELEITPRELEILGLIAAGLSNREIGERLFVSENTVKTHSSRLFDKLNAKRRTQAVQIGKANRLIP